MKRIFLVGLAVVAIFAFGVSLVAAQGPDPDAVPVDGYGRNFVDADGDGICDNCGGGSYGQMYGNRGANFVDEDGDGVCDNCGSGSFGQMYGRGAGNFAYGDGVGFVDEDGDGICDNAGSGLYGPRGQGRGRMGNRNAAG